MSACAHQPRPPLAPERPVKLEAQGEVRSDPFFWMKNREDPEVIRHLKDENAYIEEVLTPVRGLREKIYQELRARVQPNDASVPFRKGEYFYYRRFEGHKEYPIYARRKGSLTAPEEILLDVNELAVGHDFTNVPFPEVSPDQTKIIYAADFFGRRFYALFVKDLAKNKLVGDPIPNTTGNVEWANDNQTIFYTKQDPETLRSRWVYRRKIGHQVDELVFEEKDEAYTVQVGKARTDAFLFLVSEATLSMEWRLIDANQPQSKPQVFLPREAKHEYSLEDGVDGFYVVTNWQARNFRLMKAPRRPAKKEEWVECVPHREDVLLEEATFFRSHYVLSERMHGQTRLRVMERKKDGGAEEIAFPDPVFVAGVDENPNYETPFLRYRYESLHQPATILDYVFTTRVSEPRKVQAVPTFDPQQYSSERFWAKARDGTMVPVSLVYKKGFTRNGKSPLLLYAYGSYGLSMEPWFSSEIFSLLDRGFVYAIAHVRGGSEMGRSWYEEGKLLKKQNTFTDFIDVTEQLVRDGYGDLRHVYAQGESAGGLLMGAIANLRPDLYRGINAGVPFVDILTTMLDESIPLTTGEYDEWGDPRKPEFYRAMRAYSPYDNVTAQDYPNMLITAGLHDSQVQYWEPAKWAAKLRKKKTDHNLVLLFTEMDAGHSGASGRYESLKQISLQYAFYLFLEGARD